MCCQLLLPPTSISSFCKSESSCTVLLRSAHFCKFVSNMAGELENICGPHLTVIPCNDQIKELQTIIRDRTTSQSDFVFSADRLIRLMVEEGLNQLPYSPCSVITPTGQEYEGVKFAKGNCGVSISRSGEVMEKGLRECCRSIRIGKVLIEKDRETEKPRVVYAKLIPDIVKRKVLLLYPIMNSGQTVVKALEVLKEHGVEEQNIILLNLFCTSQSVTCLMSRFPEMKILTSEVHQFTPTHFGEKYFGTE